MPNVALVIFASVILNVTYVVPSKQPVPVIVTTAVPTFVLAE